MLYSAVESFLSTMNLIVKKKKERERGKFVKENHESKVEVPPGGVNSGLLGVSAALEESSLFFDPRPPFLLEGHLSS